MGRLLVFVLDSYKFFAECGKTRLNGALLIFLLWLVEFLLVSLFPFPEILLEQKYLIFLVCDDALEHGNEFRRLFLFKKVPILKSLIFTHLNYINCYSMSQYNLSKERQHNYIS